MPRDPISRQLEPVPENAPAAPTIPSRALVASAVAYKGKVSHIWRGVQDWQRECYYHFGICGEARYAARFMGHSLSRAVLRIEQVTPEGRTPLTSGPAVDLLDDLFAGKDGQEQMLEAFGVHLTIAGECWLVGRSTAMDQDDPMQPSVDGEHDIWEVVSVLEMRVNGDQWFIQHEGYQPIPLDIGEGGNDVAIRIWMPDPAERTKAESPFKSLLSSLREIEALTAHIMSQVKSRLLGAGLMFVSQDIDFPPPPPGPDGKPRAYSNQVTGLMYLLAATMEEAYKDPSSAAANVPIMVSVPGDQIKKSAELMKFWSEIDDKAREMRNDSIRRFALGMEMPPEQMLGMGSNAGTGGGTSNGVSHWGAWQIEEQTIKMFVEPMLALVCNFITVAYLRPLMTDDLTGDSILAGERVIADTTNLRLRPDRSKESVELNDRGLLKDEITILENGFDKTDMMNEEDRKWWLLRKIATASATPDQIAAAAKMLVGIDLPSGMGQIPRGDTPDRSLDDHPTRDLPELAQAAALLAAADALCFQALQRAGNKLKRQHGNPAVPGLTAAAMHTKFACNGSIDRMMADAWPNAMQVLAGIDGVDPAKTITQLDDYCRSLITSQQPHSRERLREFLEV